MVLRVAAYLDDVDILSYVKTLCEVEQIVLHLRHAGNADPILFLLAPTVVTIGAILTQIYNHIRFSFVRFALLTAVSLTHPVSLDSFHQLLVLIYKVRLYIP